MRLARSTAAASCAIINLDVSYSAKFTSESRRKKAKQEMEIDGVHNDS